MEIDWATFIDKNASALFALVGALGGGLLSFFGAIILKKREFNLSTSGKLLDRRITAHEKVVSLAVEMRIMVATGGYSESGEIHRAPSIMVSRDSFENWFTRFTQLSMEGTSWLSTETKREVNFVQDYLVTLHVYIENVPSEKFLYLGEIIRQDFIDLSSALEKTAFNFFQRGIRKLKPDSLSSWHKYKRDVTERRLSKTKLITHQNEFSALKISDESDR